jgi:hypothetical protein
MTALYPVDLRLNPSNFIVMYPLPGSRMPVLQIEIEGKTAWLSQEIKHWTFHGG